ncbi:hypothetical protein, partial [Caulobacter sp. 17J65-9]|uniref:bestrophin-like domain n=1 Tax=Caulobacter sp. 17J65-9 TaxID=2709382 RepID=UPI0013C76975
MTLFDEVPLWVLGVSLAVGMILTEELAFRLRRAISLRWEPTQEGPGVGYLISAALALLGLLIAFTFSMAATHHDLRNEAVAAEANAIRTAYLRYQLVEEPARSELSGLIVEYLGLRERADAAVAEPERAKDIAEDAARMQERIWAALTPAVHAPAQGYLATPLLLATNEMFAAGASRRAATETRVPVVILRTLILYAMMCALFMGYGLASGGRHFAASTTLFLLIALTISLVVDIDRPRPGAVRIDEAPLERAAARIRRSEAAKAQAVQPQDAGEPAQA